VNISISAGEVIGLGWKVYKKNAGILIGITIVGVLIEVFMAVPFELGKFFLSAGQALALSAVGSILSTFVSLYIGLGMVNVALKAARDEDVDFQDLFVSTDLFFRYLLATIILVLFILAPAIPSGILFFAGITEGDSSFIILGAVLTIIPIVVMIYLLVRWAVYALVILDGASGAGESLSESSRLTDGNRISILGLYVLLFLIVIAGILACILGLFIVSIPLANVAIACLYISLSGKKKASDRIPPRAGLSPPELGKSDPVH